MGTYGNLPAELSSLPAQTSRPGWEGPRREVPLRKWSDGLRDRIAPGFPHAKLFFLFFPRLVGHFPVPAPKKKTRTFPLGGLSCAPRGRHWELFGRFPSPPIFLL